ATRSVGKPWPSSHRWRESEPRCFWTTRWARPPGVRRGSQVRRRSCRAALPMRIGGLDQMASNLSAGSSSSAKQNRTLSRRAAGAGGGAGGRGGGGAGGGRGVGGGGGGAGGGGVGA